LYNVRGTERQRLVWLSFLVGFVYPFYHRLQTGKAKTEKKKGKRKHELDPVLQHFLFCSEILAKVYTFISYC
jgi:hypothetical protein